MNTVLARLREDHVNFAKVLHLIARQAGLAAAGGEADLGILDDAAEYLDTYAGRIHDPLENIIAERLKRIRPAVIPAVDAIMNEHQDISARLAQLKALIADARKGRSIGGAEFAAAGNELVTTLLKHMARENADLFPAAQAVISPHDWTLIEERAGQVHDPLFGHPPAARLERLRQLLRVGEADEYARPDTGRSHHA